MNKIVCILAYCLTVGLCASVQAAVTNLAVAIYSGTGAASDKTLAVYRAVAAVGHRPMAISRADITRGRLTRANFDVLIIPSGEDGSPHSVAGFGHYADDTNALSTAAAQNAIRGYVNSGGGFVGLEGGAIFACVGPNLLGLCSATYYGNALNAKNTMTITDSNFGSGTQEAWLSEGGGYFDFSYYTPTYPQYYPSTVATDSGGRPAVMRANYGYGRVALSAYCLELRGDSEDDWTIWDNWAMGGTHSNSQGAWSLLGRLIGWAYNGDASAPTVLSLPNPAASRVAIVATHTTDGGAYPGLLPALGRAISYSGHRPLAIRFQEIIGNRLVAANFKVVTFPGGYAYGYKTGLAGSEQKIRDFLSNGGSYFGICAGSFYAASNVVWQGQSYSYPLGIYPKPIVGEIADIVPWPGYALTPTLVSDTVLGGSLGTIQQMYYGGGYHEMPPVSPNMSIIASSRFTYSGSASNKADAVRYRYGQGRVFLITTHPEARAGSVEDWVYWDGFLNESSVTVVNPDNPWRVVHAVFNGWLANPRVPPAIKKRYPALSFVSFSEGASAAFGLTADDDADPDAGTRGMSNITWYVDGELKQTTKAGAPNAVTSEFTLRTDVGTVRGSAARVIEVRAVALDREGGETATNWTVRVNNVPAAQTVAFPALPAKALGDADFALGAAASSGLAVVYSNSNPAVVRIDAGVARIVGTGSAILTASQPGDFDFKAATPVRQTLTVKARVKADTPSGYGAVSGEGLYAPGTKVVLTARPSAGCAFLRWEDGSQSAARSFTMPNANVAVSAWFKPATNVPPSTVASPGPRQAMVGVYYAQPLEVQSESLPTVTVTGLPAGLAYEAATRTVKGVPTAAVSNKVVTVTARNVNKTPGTNSFVITVAPLDARAQGAFSGYAADTDGEAYAVAGLLTATVSAQGAVSARVAAQAGAVSFTGKSWDSASGGVFRATMKTAKGETLTLAQDVSAAWDAAGLAGSLAGGAFSNAALKVRAQRNASAAKAAADYAAATYALARYKGYYTVALPPEAELEAPGAAGNVPLGSGWLALTVKDGGAVALAGKLADGTALSGASTLLVLAVDGAVDEVAYVPFLFPLYSARGGFSGVLEILPGAPAPTGNVVVASEDFAQAWRYPGRAPTAKPAQTEDRFALAAGVSGGWYSPLADLRRYYSNAWFAADGNAVSNVYASGAYTAAVGIVTSALPEEALRFDPKSGVISLPAGKAPVYDSAASNTVYAVTNPAVATLTVLKATGLFSGTFNLYYEYRDQKGSLQLKTVPVTHEGALTPVRAAPDLEPSGRGFYLVPDTWKTPGAKPVTYPLKRSYGVEIRDEE